MKIKRLFFSGIGFFILFGLLTGCQDHQSRAPVELEPIVIGLVVENDVRPTVSEIVRRFHNMNYKLADGRPISIELRTGNGIEGARLISTGELKTELWLSPFPQMTEWVNSNLRNLGPIQAECQPLFQSPLVFVSSSTHLAPDTGTPVSWGDLFSRSADDPVKSFLQIDPLSSSIGLLTYMQLYLLATPQGDNLGEQLTTETIEQLKLISQQVSRYGSTPKVLLDRISSAHSSKLITLVPSHLISSERSESLRTHIPKSQLSMDYQVCISQADWITHAHHAGIRMFLEFLRDPSIKDYLQSYGYQTTDKDDKEQIDQPAIDPTVIDQLHANWNLIRRPAQYVFVVDTSSSMGDDGALDAAKRAIRNLIARAGERDQFALVSFATGTRINQEFSSDRYATIANLDRLQPLGGSAMYDAIREGFSLLLEEEDKTDFRKVIIVICDGEDLNSKTSLPMLNAVLQEHQRNMHYQFILFGLTNVKPEHTDLREIADSAAGEYHEIPVSHLEQTLEQILRS